MLYLDESLKPFFNDKQPLFDQLMALQGEVFRHLEGRTTMRVKLGDKFYFIKQHRGVGYWEILKNLLQGRWPVVSARNEWRAIHKLQTLNVAVPHLVAYGERGRNPATRESFILMEELHPIISLEDLTAKWPQNPPKFAYKQDLLVETARIAHTLHAHGINHRDFYICHLLLNQEHPEWHELTLYLIDLHRAELRANVPERWLIKDLAALYFSSLDAGLTRRDYLRFMKYYRQQPLRDILHAEDEFWMKVKKRGDDLYRDHASR